MSKTESKLAYSFLDAVFFALGGVLLLFGLYMLMVASSSGVLATGNTLGPVIYGLGFGFCGFLIMSLTIMPRN